VLEYVGSGDDHPVVVDLGGVTFVDTHGVLPLLRSGVVVVAASAAVRRLFTVLGAPVPRGLPPVPAVRRPVGRRPAGHFRAGR
jgi:hypothetical protein